VSVLKLHKLQRGGRALVGLKGTEVALGVGRGPARMVRMTAAEARALAEELKAAAAAAEGAQ
jgi:hypothetical protein